jgi:hypothetical protein
MQGTAERFNPVRHQALGPHQLVCTKENDMGTHFFRAGGAPKVISGGPTNLAARAFGASSYAARGAAAGAQKDLGAAQAINKAGAFKPMKRSAAYPKGPKV